ncbi:MAG: M48 family metalloprotease [Candidatus Aminicenantes bacterium]|nr:M48 family metalloprotease [Candidatus Aminicenantes bacterium]
MKEKKEKIIFILLAGFSLAFLSCSVNPVTGEKELTLISISQEKALGQQTDLEIKAQYGLVEAEKIAAYINELGQALVPYTHRPELDYHFAVLDTPVINAFAVPGGYVYVTRGILALINHEAELVTILGHELGHISARHSLKRLSQMILVQTGLAVMSAIDKRLADLSGLASVGLQLLFLKYSRDDEYQADRLGVMYARRAGWSPVFIINFFQSLEKLGDLSGGRPLPGFLSTHPLTKDRIERVKAMLNEEDYKLKVNSSQYLQNLQGLVFGDDPRQGFVEKGKFYHPKLRFVFSLPEDWTVQNTASQVRLSSKDGQAALILLVEKSSEELASYAEKKISSIKGAKKVKEDRLETGNLPSYHAYYLIESTEGETLYLRLGLIRYGDHIFSFFGLAPWRNYSSYDEKFKNSIGSFEELKEASYLNRQPQRISLVRANGQEKVIEIFKRENVPQNLWKQLAIMNQSELETVPPPGTLLKIVK